MCNAGKGFTPSYNAWCICADLESISALSMQGHAGRDMDDMWYPALWDEAIFFIMLGEEKKSWYSRVSGCSTQQSVWLFYLTKGWVWSLYGWVTVRLCTHASFFHSQILWRLHKSPSNKTVNQDSAQLKSFSHVCVSLCLVWICLFMCFYAVDLCAGICVLHFFL